MGDFSSETGYSASVIPDAEQLQKIGDDVFGVEVGVRIRADQHTLAAWRYSQAEMWVTISAGVVAAISATLAGLHSPAGLTAGFALASAALISVSKFGFGTLSEKHRRVGTQLASLGSTMGSFQTDLATFTVANATTLRDHLYERRDSITADVPVVPTWAVHAVARQNEWLDSLSTPPAGWLKDNPESYLARVRRETGQSSTAVRPIPAFPIPPSIWAAPWNW